MLTNHGQHERGIIDRHRDGFALVVALGAIVVIGALIAGAFWTSMQHYRATRNSLSKERALNAAEFGQNWVLANWNSAATKKMQMGDTIVYSPTVPGGLGTADVRLTRLNTTTYWVVSEGKSGAGEGAVLRSRARTNVILRLDTPNIYVTGALTTGGTTSVSGNAQINANDNTPSGWSQCPAAGAAKPAIVNDNPAAEVSASGMCGANPCVVTNNPTPVATDPKAGQPNTYTQYGGLNWDSLTNIAQTQYPSKVFTATGSTKNKATAIPSTLAYPTALAGICQTASATNWGEPDRTTTNAVYPHSSPCEDYYPIIWVKGAPTSWAVITNVRGQGILLVEGNLVIAGGMHFAGLIIVKGQLVVEGNSTPAPKIAGAVLAQGGASIAGGASIQYSSCALSQAFAGQNPPPVPVASRPWGDMF